MAAVSEQQLETSMAKAQHGAVMLHVHSSADIRFSVFRQVGTEDNSSH